MKKLGLVLIAFALAGCQSIFQYEFAKDRYTLTGHSWFVGLRTTMDATKRRAIELCEERGMDAEINNMALIQFPDLLHETITAATVTCKAEGPQK